MSDDKCIALLGGWEGYCIGTVGRRQVEGRREVWIELVPAEGYRPRCSGCGEPADQVHEVTQRWVRDLPLLDADTWLLVHRRRVNCAGCGPKLEQLDWLERYGRVTRRMADSVARLCSVLPIKHVAQWFSLGWDQVKAIDKAHLLEKVGEVDLSGVEVIGMDEFAIHKGHRYATVVIEPFTRRVLWVGRGRGREDVQPFFQLLGEDGRRRLKAVVMDMNPAYEQQVRAECPGAEIVYDLFHVVAKYARQVVDRVRVDEANRLRQDQKARRVIKGSRWLLLRSPDKIDRPQDRVRLQELLDANHKLWTVYVLKEDLKHLWDYRDAASALRYWKQWYRRAMYSRIDPLKTFARNLKGYLQGILSHCRWPLHTGVIEGINNKIKVIKRMAYGFRDDDYFFLKIRAAFPGNSG